MKTKIIYISGSEIFDMADVRSAFEEVRNALNLGKDTIMFGVPVDSDNALEKTETNVTTIDTVVPAVPELAPNESISETMPSITAEPKKTASVRKSRTKNTVTKNDSQPTESNNNSNVSMPDQPSATEHPIEDIENKVVSILSVLTTKELSDTATPEQTTEIVEDVVPVIESDTDTEQFTDTTTETQNTESLVVDDMLSDDVPTEQTLEELLETMTPLGEDASVTTKAQTTDTESTTDTALVPDTSSEDTDTTLAQLATEFAENQNKIPTAKGSRGRISKLRNILPFKKAKQDDSGLMGDLLGWAGIAANDDDFVMPGFFANAGSKK